MPRHRDHFFLATKTCERSYQGAREQFYRSLDRLQVETTDLGENDVGLIEVGNEAVISFDSLPDTKITGTVAKIAPKSDVGLGVNYPVIIKLEQVPEALRWGMTAFVDIAHD